MTKEHITLRHTGDVIASAGALFAGVSQFAQIATPILTFLIALATLGWWVIRFTEWWDKKDTGEPL